MSLVDLPARMLPSFDAVAASALCAADVEAPPACRGEFEFDLPLRHAGVHRVRIAWELLGPPGAPVVLVAGGISAHRHVVASAAFPEAGWAGDLAGDGRALDPAKTRVLGFDYVGADGRTDAPIDTADQADAVAALLDALHVEALQAFVGYSYGALVGLQFAVRHPRRLAKLVAVSGAHRAHPYAAAWRALQRKAVALGQLQCADVQGLSLARQFAMLSYRTPEEFEERFDAPPEVSNGRVRVAAEDYLDAAGARFVARTPVNAWLRLSESIDLHRIDPSQVAVPTLVVAVEGDRLVPLSDSVALVEGLGHAGQLRVLRSPYGHDAFLKETDRIDGILAGVLHNPGDPA
ncbi:homoserine O-succinyltransferase [Luteimonas viscosa]|uniref:Homoserine O-succinyltransferase n=1 Tax=Luteimonas viscosa TaxID=1132694 RepID=A0A5D4XNK0_9GAMM|nr:homoserine O-succinyltransferase [Luteimonas viscosa]TYT25684.1 homoserine O-succinyltransferase [Luteimonas viscosa]